MEESHCLPKEEMKNAFEFSTKNLFSTDLYIEVSGVFFFFVEYKQAIHLIRVFVFFFYFKNLL